MRGTTDTFLGRIGCAQIEAVLSGLDRRIDDLKTQAAYGSKAPRRFALATGMAGDSPKTVAVAPMTDPPGGAGFIAGMVTVLWKQVMRDDVAELSGVFAPEEIVAPDRFFDVLTEQLAIGGHKTGDFLRIATCT